MHVFYHLTRLERISIITCQVNVGIVLDTILAILHVNHHKNAIQATNKMCPFDLNQFVYPWTANKFHFTSTNNSQKIFCQSPEQAEHP